MTDNSKNNKRIAKNTLLLYFRMLFTMAVSLYTSRVVLNTLGVEDFGIYNVVGGVVAMFAILNTSMIATTQRYITFEIGSGEKKLNKIFSTSLNIHLLIAISVLILAETIGLWFFYNKMVIPSDRVTAAFWVYQFSILTCLVMIMSVPYNSIIIAYEKMSAFAYVSVLEVVLKLLVVYLLLIVKTDRLISYAILMFLIQIISRIIYGVYCSKHFKDSKYKYDLDVPLMKEMLGFAGWNLYSGIAVLSTGQGLNIMINLFFGPTVNAARAIGMQVQNAIMAFSSNFQTALNPQITKSYATKDIERTFNLIYASSKFSFFLLLILALPIIIKAQYVLSLWLGIVPEYSANFMRLTLIICTIEALANPLSIASSATGKIKQYMTRVGSCYLLILPCAYIALKTNDSPYLVYIIHLIFVIIAQIIRIITVKKIMQLSFDTYFKKVLGRIIPVLILSTAIPLIINTYLKDSIFHLAVLIGICTVNSCFWILLIGLTRNEQNIIIQKIKNKIHSN